MNDVPPNDAQPARSAGSLEPDAHGQAALLLAESLLHALVEGQTLSNEDAIGVIATACEVKVDVAALTGESCERMNESLTLLRSMSVSFSADGARPLDSDQLRWAKGP